MKTWIVTFEVIAFVVIYFPCWDLADSRPGLVHSRGASNAYAYEFNQDPLLIPHWIVEDHIRPPPRGSGVNSLYGKYKMQIGNQQALSESFGPSFYFGFTIPAPRLVVAFGSVFVFHSINRER